MYKEKNEHTFVNLYIIKALGGHTRKVQWLSLRRELGIRNKRDRETFPYMVFCTF